MIMMIIWYAVTKKTDIFDEKKGNILHKSDIMGGYSLVGEQVG